MSKSLKIENGGMAGILALGALLWAAPLCAQDIAVSLQGKVVDGQGQGIAGATVKLVETNLTTASGADGTFDLKGTFQSGVLRRASLPGGGRLEYRGGRLTLVPAGRGQALLISPLGTVRRISWEGREPVAVESWLGEISSGHWILKVEEGAEARSFRLIRQGRGRVVLLAGTAGSRSRGAGPLAKTAVDSASLVLEVSASGHRSKRFFEDKPVKGGLALALLPAAATRKEILQDFIGAGKTFRLAYLKKENATSRKHILHYVDFAEMAGDTLPEHAFPDSKGPETTPFGANVPSWSPDGKTLAYEIGAENQTVANVSRIWIQPLQGAKVEGPAYPATNPRWWTDGAADTALIWCTSGREDGWKDTASRTLWQKYSGQTPKGEPLILARGSFHGGLSANVAYLASAFRLGVMMETATSARRFFHVYPGTPPAKDGSNTDSLQACNPSISPDPKRPSRMLFLDFGVPPGEAPYPNIVRPRNYAQHQMILIGDFLSEAPGRIVDFIDSPAEELAKEKTWDDPEWSNHPDFAVATTRDPDGDLSNPGEPRPTQPDIYLIHLPTKASVKVLSGTHQIMPVLWVGPQ